MLRTVGFYAFFMSVANSFRVEERSCSLPPGSSPRYAVFGEQPGAEFCNLFEVEEALRWRAFDPLKLRQRFEMRTRKARDFLPFRFEQALDLLNDLSGA